MALFTALKPYIDLGMTAELLLESADREKSLVYVYKLLSPEDEDGFSGYYYHEAYDLALEQRVKSYHRTWETLKATVGTEMANDPHWKLDPTPDWETGILGLRL